MSTNHYSDSHIWAEIIFDHLYPGIYFKNGVLPLVEQKWKDLIHEIKQEWANSQGTRVILLNFWTMIELQNISEVFGNNIDRRDLITSLHDFYVNPPEWVGIAPMTKSDILFFIYVYSYIDTDLSLEMIDVMILATAIRENSTCYTRDLKLIRAFSSIQQIDRYINKIPIPSVMRGMI